MARAAFLPPRRHRGTFLIPLLVVPLVAYDLLGFFLYGGGTAAWSQTVFGVPMVSGVRWEVTAGDLLVALGLVALFFEVIKSARSGPASVVEHILSTAVFVAALIEFLLVPVAASSTFFMLTLMSLIDVVAGFSVSMIAAERDVNYD